MTRSLPKHEVGTEHHQCRRKHLSLDGSMKNKTPSVASGQKETLHTSMAACSAAAHPRGGEGSHRRHWLWQGGWQGRKEHCGCTCSCRLLEQENEVDQAAFLCHPKHRAWQAVTEGCDHLHSCWERMSGMQTGEKFQHLLP